MNLIQVATFTHNGRPFYSFATALEAGEANAVAGDVCDYLTDTLGDGFAYQVSPVDWLRTGPAGEGDRIQVRGAANDAFAAADLDANPAPTAALCITPHQAELMGGALEVGADCEEWADSDYQQARELMAKLESVQAGGSVVIQVQA
jgi:hypothetical protein